MSVGKQDHSIGQNVEADSDSKSADEESDTEDPIAKYRSLLNGIEEEEKEKKQKDVHMEISWGLGLKEKAEEAVKKRMSTSKELTPFQEMMEKRKQKRQEKKKLKLQKKVLIKAEAYCRCTQPPAHCSFVHVADAGF